MPPERMYLAGPMTGHRQFNFPLFDRVTGVLRAYGLDIVTPSELDNEADRAAAMASEDGSALSYGTGVKKTWGEFLARDVRLLADDGIEAIIVLPGWETSRGARLETFVGNAMCGMPVFAFEETPFSPTGFRLVRLRYLDLVKAWAAKDDISFHTRAEQDRPRKGAHV